MAEPYSITAKIKISKNAFQKYLKSQSVSRDAYSDWTDMDKSITKDWIKDIRKSEGKDLDKGTNADYFAGVLIDIINTPLQDIFIFKYLEEEQTIFYYRMINHDWYVFVRSELTALREISKYKDIVTEDMVVISNYPYADGFNSNFAILKIFKEKSHFIKNDTSIKEITRSYASSIDDYFNQLGKKYKDPSVGDYFKDKKFIEPIIRNRYLSLLKRIEKEEKPSKIATATSEKPFYLCGNFYTDGKNVYTHAVIEYRMVEKVVKDADPYSFKPLKDNYYIDKNFAYHFYQKIEGSHGPTFKVLPGTDGVYCLDKNYLYYSGNLLKDVDVKNYKLIKNAFVISGHHVFIYGEKADFLDGETFEVLSSYYFKDKKGIYGLNVYPLDKELVKDSLEIKEADKETFEVVFDNFDTDYAGGEHCAYAKDKNNAYFKNAVLKGIDPENFNYKGKGYLIDGQNIYYLNKRIQGSDAKTLDIDLPFYFAKDKNKAYYCGIELPNVDIKTFKVLPNSAYARDKNKIYYMSKAMVNVDIDSFEVVTWNQAKDKKSKIYMDERI